VEPLGAAVHQRLPIEPTAHPPTARWPWKEPLATEEAELRKLTSKSRP
jgi:hypothetical protein